MTPVGSGRIALLCAAMISALPAPAAAEELFAQGARRFSVGDPNFVEARLVIFDSDTGAELDSIDRPDPTEDFVLAVGPNGDIYSTISQSGSGSIRRYDATSLALVDTFGASGALYRDIVFGPDGRLYAQRARRFSVGDPNFVESRLVVFDPLTGAELDGIDRPDPTEDFVIAVGPNGDVYATISLSGSGSIRRYDGTSLALVDTFAASGALYRDIDFGPDEFLYAQRARRFSVGDPNFVEARLVVLDPLTGSEVDGIDRPDPTEDFVIAVGAGGDIYTTISQSGSGSIRRYDGTSLALVDTFGASGALYRDITFVPEPSRAHLAAMALAMLALVRGRRSGSSPVEVDSRAGEDADAYDGVSVR